MKSVICIEMLYPGSSAEEKIERIADHGFDAVEFWGWGDKDLGAIAESCGRRGVRIANASAHHVGSPVARKTHAALLEDFTRSLEAAARVGCRKLMVLSNELGEGGSAADAYPEIEEREKFRSFVDLLGSLLERAPVELSLLIEPLNNRVDHQGTYLADMETAERLVKEVGSPRLSVLCDVYHMAVMGADPVATLRRYKGCIGHVHLADVPGRHEPGTGGLDWKGIIRTLEEIGYSGDVGFEYSPSYDSDASLEAVKRLLPR